LRLPDLRSASRPQPRRRPGANARLLALAGTGVVAGGAFGAVAVASARRDTVEPDNELHDAMRESLDGPVGRAAEAAAPAVEPAARWWVYGPAALAAAAAVLAAPDQSRRPKRRRRAGAAAIAVVPALVTAISPAFDRWLPQPPVGPRRRPVDHPVFPSGHAFRAAAVALTGGYVVAREELARPGARLGARRRRAAAVGASPGWCARNTSPRT
jgi:hypothetical protein